jgi:predicted AlkP superfamily phosphohydrolase/phosphomutase
MSFSAQNSGESSGGKIQRRTFLKRAGAVAAVGAAAAGGAYWVGSRYRVSRALGKKVIVIGVDGMDPILCESMMKEGLLPNFAKLRASGAFSPLGTSIPPQSPVAWANFINGSGPGSHGIFDFVHRHPHEQCSPFYSAAESLPGEGHWDVGDHRLQLDFWPFNHTPPKTVLRRQGVPFWDYLDQARIPSTFYDLPSNYPPSPSHYGYHRCISGMGTPDLMGEYGTYQFYADSNAGRESNPEEPADEGFGKHFKLTFENDTAKTYILGGQNTFLRTPAPVKVPFAVHRDRQAGAAVIEIQGHKLVLKEGQWSRWLPLNFEFVMPWFVPNENLSGIVRFFLQEVSPNFKLYVTPINIDPSNPAVQMSEPASFVKDVSKHVGLFHTTGFQEAYQARMDSVFNDDEFQKQANIVLEERLAQFEFALDNYEDGLFFFYFSSSDLQSHIFWWWNSPTPHPLKSEDEVQKSFNHVRQLYQRLDKEVVGQILDRHGGRATILVMSDHGFGNFGRQFNLNSWLRENGYLFPEDCSSVLSDGDVDWSKTKAYGIGINGLYLNLKGRERDGIVEPGAEQQQVLADLVSKLEAVKDEDVPGEPSVIRKVYRADAVYSGSATALAPDLIVGYRRGYRASWDTSKGLATRDVLSDNTNAWSADHCADAEEVPGILFANRPLNAQGSKPMLIDIAPSILTEFGQSVPSTMTGRNVFST